MIKIVCKVKYTVDPLEINSSNLTSEYIIHNLFGAASALGEEI